MKRLLAAFLMVVCVFGSCGCSEWIKDSYQSVSPHIEQQPQPTTQPPIEEPAVITNRNELRGAVLSCIRDWTERSELRVHDYSGDIQTDLTESVAYATEEDPIGAYAVDHMDAELTGSEKSGTISLAIVFRRSAAEIDAIVTVNGIANANYRIQKALEAYDTSLTLRIRNYQETDYAAYIRDYCLKHPDAVVALPELSAEVYPKDGETRILELHFAYPETRDTMRTMLASVNTILSSASSYISACDTDAECAALLYRFLTTRLDYTLDDFEPTMPAYRLLCEGAASSLAFSSVFYSECTSAGLECLLVTGIRGEQPYYWNIINIDGAYFHVDLMRGIGSGEPELLTGTQLRDEGYFWDEAAYPAPPEEPDDPNNPNPPDLPPEPTEPLPPPTTAAEPTEPPATSVPEEP